MSKGAIVRGPQTEKKIALVFAGHEYAEGGDTILNELARPNRSDEFHIRFGELLDFLTAKGYQFVSVDELDR